MGASDHPLPSCTDWLPSVPGGASGLWLSTKDLAFTQSVGSVDNQRPINEMWRIERSQNTVRDSVPCEPGCSKVGDSPPPYQTAPRQQPTVRMANSPKAHQLGTSTNSCAEPVLLWYLLARSLHSASLICAHSPTSARCRVWQPR